MGKVKFDWTTEAIARLQDLVAQGLTASAIVELLGPGVLTRNAVIGKSHREKIKLQTPPGGSVGREKKPPEVVAADAHQPVDAAIAAFPRRSAVTHDRGVPYLQLERWHCKALLDERRDGLPMCCGRRRCHDANGIQTPYCAEHLQLYTNRAAYVPRPHRVR